MSHFAKVSTLTDGKGVVEEVIVADQNFINSGLVGLPGIWYQTSYNSRGNVHYGDNGLPSGGTAFRANYAGPGSILDTTVVIDGVIGVFYRPQQDLAHTLNTSTWTWEAPGA
jgi:hypothetical protein